MSLKPQDTAAELDWDAVFAELRFSPDDAVVRQTVDRFIEGRVRAAIRQGERIRSRREPQPNTS